MELLTLAAKSFLENGPLGLLGLIGWLLSAWLLYKQNEVNKQVSDASDKRVLDLKEITKDFTDLSTKTIETLDKLTDALQIRKR